MRIAVASDDAVSIGSHFGRSRCFVVFDAVDGTVTRLETRTNDQESGGESGHGDAHAHDAHAHEGGHHAHDHGRFAELLGDCDGVISGGIGRGAVVALEQAGIAVATCPVDWTPDAAVRAFAGQLLDTGHQQACDCGHAHD